MSQSQPAILQSHSKHAEGMSLRYGVAVLGHDKWAQNLNLLPPRLIDLLTHRLVDLLSH